MTQAPYNANPELVAMKNDIADRMFRVKLIGMAVTATLAVGAIAAMIFLPTIAPALMGGEMAKVVIAGGMAAASGITSLITMKEVKKLEMDEQFLQSYMQGKNYWGEGYRQEVAEHGFSLQSPLIQGAPPPQRGPQRAS